MADINCAVDCQNGCVLGEQCPHKPEQQKAAEFIEKTSLDDILAIAAEAVRKKQQARVSEGPKWVFPEDGIAPEA